LENVLLNVSFLSQQNTNAPRVVFVYTGHNWGGRSPIIACHRSSSAVFR